MTAKEELLRLYEEGGSHARIEYLRNKIKRATIAELRRLLGERGVRFNKFKFMTQWAGALGESVEAYPTDMFPDTLLVKHVFLTPEQAIEATLGRGECGADETETISVRGDTWGTYFDKHMTIHVMECSACGGTYEHVNGSYEFCPRCGAKVVGK